MTSNRSGVVAALLIALLIRPAFATDSGFLGAWRVELVDGQRTLVGVLEIERNDEGFVAYLEGGPARVELESLR